MKQEKAPIDFGRIGFGLAMAIVVGIAIFCTIARIFSHDAGDEVTWVG